MTKTDIIKFLNESESEWHWNSSRTELFLIVSHYNIDDFTEMLSVDDFIDSGIPVTLLHGGYVCIDMVSILDDYGLEPLEIFNKKSWDSNNEF